MDKDNFLMNGGVNNFSTVNYRPRTMKIQPGGVPCSTPLPSSYLNVNWEVPIDQTIPFYAGLNSIVPLPPPSSVPPATSADVILGRLEGICNSAEICPQTQAIGGHLTTDASFFGSSLNSPPNLSLAMLNSNAGNSGSGLEHFSADTTFAERAAKYSCFGSRGFGGFEFQDHEMSFNGKLSRVSSNKSLQVGSGSDAIVSADFPEAEMRTDSGFVTLNGGSEQKFNRLSRASTPGTDEGERQVGLKGSIVSDQAATGQLLSKNQSENSNKKRKIVQKGKSDTLAAPNCNGVKIVETDESKLKKSRGTEAGSCVRDESKAKFEHNSDASSGDGSKKQSKESQKPAEAPKQDYIHVRARRGQATDSHSLAERVRREKISERMKFLQDLVPGCSKVIGKAVMLDEIINYVQSLQRQVEFLSMKLATVNPRLDFNVDGLLQKDMVQSRASSHMIYPLESSASVFPYGNHSQPDPLQSSITSASETQSCVSPLESTLCRSLGVQLPSTDGFGNAISQFTTCWDDDLQSVVQMAFGQNQEGGLHGSLPTSHMKIEL